MQTKTKTYTQDGVTAELWSYDSVRIHQRWTEFFKVFPGRTVGARAAFAFLVVYFKELSFEDGAAEWGRDLANWVNGYRKDIEVAQFENAWDAFLDLDDTVISFINNAHTRTRRDYIPASKELATDENDAPGDEDFLAEDESGLLTSA